MADPTWTETATAWATIVAAGGTCATALIALYAALTWKYTLKNQRADECVSAARGVVGAVGRCLRTKTKENLTNMAPVWHAYDEVWESWRRFDQAYSAARRYHPEKLSNNIAGEIARQLDNLGDALVSNWGSPDCVGRRDGEHIQQLRENLLKPVGTL
jgi:hypothetical protein